jgi:hypothetical protein
MGTPRAIEIGDILLLLGKSRLTSTDAKSSRPETLCSGGELILTAATQPPLGVSRIVSSKYVLKKSSACLKSASVISSKSWFSVPVCNSIQFKIIPDAA